MSAKIVSVLVLTFATAIPVAALAGETQPESEDSDEKPEAQPPPTTAPAAQPTAAATAPAPAQSSAPVRAPSAYPAPIWGAPLPSSAPPIQADTSVATPEPPEPPEGIVIPRWQISTGVRTAFVGNTGYDPFSENDALVQFSLGGGRTFYSQGMFSVAAIGFYDFASVHSTARGEPTNLEVHRLSLGPEFRAHLFPILHIFARPSAAALRTSAMLEESTTGTNLYARAWSVGFDATAGAGLRLLSFGREQSSVRIWLLGEGGYGWSSASDLRLAPDSEDDSAPERVADVDLGTLAVRGPMFRISIAATF